jgi:hypothetical protein
MSIVGIYGVKDRTKAALQQTGAIAPASELAIFEDHFMQKTMSLARGAAAAQMGARNSLSSFNAATATYAGMTNCSVSLDGI